MATCGTLVFASYSAHSSKSCTAGLPTFLAQPPVPSTIPSNWLAAFIRNGNLRIQVVVAVSSFALYVVLIEAFRILGEYLACGPFTARISGFPFGFSYHQKSARFVFVGQTSDISCSRSDRKSQRQLEKRSRATCQSDTALHNQFQVCTASISDQSSIARCLFWRFVWIRCAVGNRRMLF